MIRPNDHRGIPATGGAPKIPTRSLEYLRAAATRGADLPNRTFVIGLPGSEESMGASYDPRSMLSTLAEAGGTAADPCEHEGPNHCHFDLTQEPNLPSGLVDALGSIMEQVSAELDRTFTDSMTSIAVDHCSFPLPLPPPGYELMLSDIEAMYYPGDGTSSSGIVESATPQPCSQGWTVDDPQDPTKIELCEDTCAQIQADPDGAVEIRIGCP